MGWLLRHGYTTRRVQPGAWLYRYRKLDEPAPGLSDRQATYWVRMVRTVALPSLVGGARRATQPHAGRFARTATRLSLRARSTRPRSVAGTAGGASVASTRATATLGCESRPGLRPGCAIRPLVSPAPGAGTHRFACAGRRRSHPQPRQPRRAGSVGQTHVSSNRRSDPGWRLQRGSRVARQRSRTVGLGQVAPHRISPSAAGARRR